MIVFLNYFCEGSTIAEEFVLALLPDNDQSTSTAGFALRTFCLPPLFSPMSFHCVECRLKATVYQNVGQTAVFSVVKLDDPERLFGC
jgi:hypothetical protein